MMAGPAQFCYGFSELIRIGGTMWIVTGGAGDGLRIIQRSSESSALEHFHDCDLGNVTLAAFRVCGDLASVHVKRA